MFWKNKWVIWIGLLGLSAALTNTAQAKGDNCLPFLSGLLDQKEMIAPAKTLSPKNTTYLLPATAQWSVYDSRLKPVLTINPGDTVAIETMAASDNPVVPGATIEQIVKIQNAIPGRGPHTLTGPIYINGAEPGDVLRIHFNKIIPQLLN